MADYTFDQLVDLAQVRQLLESHHKLSKMAYGVFDTDEHCLVAVGWQDICVRFHRVNPVSLARCRESDAYIKARLRDFEGDFFEYRCRNGMIDVAMPIIIDGKHLATFFTGQFFYDDDLPDEEFFLMQAEALGFDVEEYLKSLERVPIFSREQIRGNLLFLHNMVRVMAEMGLNNLRLACEISERKRLENEVISSRNFLSNIINAIADPVFVKDAEHRLVLANDAECALAGCTREELQGKTDYDFFPKEQVDVFWKVDDEVLADGKPRHNEELVTDATGSTRTIVVHKSRYVDPRGNRFVVGVIRDITERKKIEHQLRLLNFALDHVREAAFLFDEHARIHYVNDEGCRWLGYGRDRLLGMGVPDIDADITEEMWREVWPRFREMGALTMESRLKAADGRIFPVEVTGSYFEWDGAGYNLALMRDITERKLMEGALRESEQKYRTLAESLPDNVVRYDRECRVTYYNNTLAETVAIEKERFLGRTPLEAHPETENTAGLYECTIRRVLAGGAPDELEIVVPHPDGGLRTHLVRIVAERDAEGAIAGALAIGRDITERKQAEEALIAREREFRTLAENLPDNIIRYDREGRRTYVNSRIIQLLEGDARRLVGKTPEEFRPGGLAAIDDYLEKLRKVLETGEPEEIEMPVQTPAGETQIHNIRLVAERDEAGRITGAMAIGRDITERKRMEEQLWIGEQQFRTLVENSPDFVSRYDREGRRTYVNPAMEKLFGRTAREMLGRRPTDMSPLAEPELFEQKLRELWQNREEFQAELPFTTAQGETHWCHFRVVPEFGPDGTVASALAIGRDITAIKEAERQLRETRSRLSAMFTTIPDLVWLKNAEGVYLACNPAFESFFGATEAEIVGKTDYDFVDKELADFFVLKDREAIAAGKVCVNEEEITYAADGRRGILETRKVPEYDADGNVVGVLGIARDITERKRMEGQLRVSEQQFRDIFDNSLDCLYLLEVTEEGRFRNLEVNPASESSFGMSRSELIGRCVDETVPEETARMVVAKYRRCLEAGTATEEEVELDLPSGRRFYHSTLVPVRNESGRIHRIVGITRDITRRKQAEQELQKALDFSEGVINAIPDLLFEMDREGRYLNVWTQKPELLAARKEILLEKTVHDVLSPESAAIMIDSIREAEEKGLSFGNILQIDLPQGPCWFELSVSKKPGGVAADVSFIVLSRDVTERKRMEDALVEREKEFRTLAENAPDVIVRYDRKCRRIYVNPAFERVNRLTSQEVLGKTPIELSTELAPLAVDFTQHLKEVLETGVATQLDLVVANDGIDSSWFVRVMPEFNSNGEVVSALTIWTDITYRKRMEQELRSSEQQFRTLTENSPNIIIRYDRDCRRLYVNPAFEGETDIPAGQAVNVTPDAFWRPTMPVEEYKDKLRLVMESGIPARIFVEWPRLDDGRITHHAFHVVAERDTDGQVTGCLAIGHNITALKEAELRLAKLAAGLPGFLYTYRLRPDGSACLPYASPQIKDIYGILPEAVTEDASETIARIHPDDVSRVRESIAESARTLSLLQAEYRIRHPEKGEIWAEGRSMPEPQPDGGILWFGFVHDITERKRTDEALAAKRQQLTAMAVELSLAEERERRRIASELHDHIGQTLILVKIKLGMLSEAFSATEDEKVFEDVRELLSHVIRDVRSLTLQLSPPILAGAGLEAALEWLGRRMDADYSLMVEFVDDKGEKPLTEELRSVVYQAARELLINVAKHAGTDRARLFIGRDADKLLLQVEDRGAGFDLPDAALNVPKEGCFGLFNLQQRIMHLGGEVTIDTARGKGTRVAIRVPLNRG